jgi:hypothetical protein
MTSKRGKRQGLRARSKNARVKKKKAVKSVDWLRKRKALLNRKAKAKGKSVVGKRAKKPRASVRENPAVGVRAPASPPPSDLSPQSGSQDAEGGTPASTEREAEFQQAGETNDPFEETLPVPAPEPYDLPDGTPNPNAPDTVYS